MWHRYEVSKCYWKSGADRLAQHGVVTNPQLFKKQNKTKNNSILKCGKVKHDKMRYACTFSISIEIIIIFVLY